MSQSSTLPSAVRRLSFIRKLLFLVIFFVLALQGVPLPSSADEITARAAVVIDNATEKILYAKNPNWKLPPASTTKLVTAMVALDRLSPDAVLTISPKAANTPSVSPHLRPGERFFMRDLLALALIRSVNGAAVALAEAVAGSEAAFTHLMNEKAMRLGAENTRFINASGLPGADQYITAFDLAKVMKESLKYPLLQESLGTRTKEIRSLEGRRLFVKNTNQLLWTDDGCIGGKTGYTRAARHCFVSASKKEQATLITAVLGESVRDDLWGDSTALLAKGYDILAQKAEPMIYFTSSNEKPIVLASYKTGKKSARHKLVKSKSKQRKSDSRPKLAKGKGGKRDKAVKAVEKRSKKKKGGRVRVAEKGKKLPGRDLS
ncbi:MAG: serine hydrolase [Alphaproteobacteria bacterium]|uniref:Serine hydrolase n=1 Tax=Candidatus Nitrobium versatile TaxID=2884831 RepID=A0A953SHI8_9BACT|nr:serine hydrolase [Candidatus Nitrobium versatile]